MNSDLVIGFFTPSLEVLGNDSQAEAGGARRGGEAQRAQDSRRKTVLDVSPRKQVARERRPEEAPGRGGRERSPPL